MKLDAHIEISPKYVIVNNYIFVTDGDKMDAHNWDLRKHKRTPKE